MVKPVAKIQPVKIEIKKSDEVNPVTMHDGRFKRTWKWFMKRVRRPVPVIAVNMELRDGMHTTFTIPLTEVRFEWSGGSYVVDDSLKYYHRGMRLYCLDYHQDFTIPIKRKYPINTIQKTVEMVGSIKVEHATNPMILERFIISKIAEGIMKGQAIDEYLKSLKMMLLIITIVTVLTFLIILGTSGILANVHL